MTNPAKPSAIRRRLMRVILLTSTLVVVLTCAAFFAYDVVTFRRATLRHHTTLAEAIATNSTAALAFENRADAQEVLGAFKADPTVQFAALLNADGSVFARYPRGAETAVPASRGRNGVFIEHGRLVANIPVIEGGHNRLGTLYFVADTSELRDRLRVYAGVIGVIVAMALALAYAIARMLQRRISDPILELASVAAAISERHDYSLRVTTYGEGELGQLTTAFNDMLKRIEEQNRSLSTSEARHRMLFENSPLPMWVYDLESRRFRAVNSAATFGYGYTADEFLRMTIDDIRPREDLAALADDMAATPAESIYRSPRVWRHIKKDGTTVLVEITSHDLVFDDLPSRLVLANDVTARVQAEQEVRRLNQELEHRVEQRTAQLEQANRELESFSYSVSHDLRAPLRHVQGYVAMLQRAVDGQLSDKAKRYLKTINDASVEMGQLIDDLLEFSRMGRSELRESVISLDNLVQECLRPLQAAAEGRNIAWDISPLPMVRGDPAMLRQVWVNLISNAIKYSRQRDPARITIGTAGMENGRVICVVRDNGAGFDMQYAHKLFGVFQRLHRAEDFEGTGIGLATVRRIINRHGGRVWAEAAIDQGAAFFFTLTPAEVPQPANPSLA